MHVVEVIPFAPGIPFETLSYFSKDEIKAGDLVSITIKRRALFGLVINISPAEDLKQSLKNASFGLKKITKGARQNFCPSALYTAISEAASLQLIPLSHLFYDLLPVKFFTQKTIPELHSVPTTHESTKHETLLLGQPHDERIIRYKGLIRESFAKKESLVIFMPTINDIEREYAELSKGIDEYVVVLTSDIGVRDFAKAMKTLDTSDHALLILATPSLLPWIRKDLATVIIEREHSTHYFTVGSASYDMREVLSTIAISLGMKCIFGSQLLSLDRYHMYKERTAQELIPLHMRNDTHLRVIPMDKDNYAATPHISYATLAILREIKARNKGHYFIYAQRKGMYPTTICSDCGTLFTCTTCNTPYILPMIGGVRTYVCHSCEALIRFDEETSIECTHCGGWRMKLLGIATGGIQESIAQEHLHVYIIDSEHTPTKTKAEGVYKAWQETSAGILIGTEMAHNMISKVDGITISSLDSLFSLPEYRIDEKIMSLVTELAEKVPQGALLLQTRMHRAPIFAFLTGHSFIDYYNESLKERLVAKLPPYYVVVKATFTNIDESFRTFIDSHIKEVTIVWYEAGGGKTLFFAHIEKARWQEDRPLRDKLQRILSDARAQVNPLHLFS